MRPSDPEEGSGTPEDVAVSARSARDPDVREDVAVSARSARDPDVREDVAALVYRGDAVESRHRAHLAVVNAHGDVVASFGDPDLVTFTRSALKPFQLAPLVASGAAEKFGFTDRELAVMSASHNAEAFHVEAVQGILEKLDLPVAALRCGAHKPYNEAAAAALTGAPTAVHNNCSGKHAGLLAQSVALGADLETYLEPQHPVQRGIRDLVARAGGVPAEKMPVGTDGCTAPNYAMPVKNAARLFATLARPEVLKDRAMADALTRIRRAMTRHPEMVAGSGRFDTAFMEAGDERLVGKVGGEAVFGVADDESGLGLFVKIEDGNSRAVGPVVTEACRQLAWLDERAFEVLGEYWRPAVKNWNGVTTGRIEPVLTLRFQGATFG